jgi:hypothetical protein
MSKYAVEIVGKSSLLMHADNVAWSDQMQKWKDSQRGGKRQHKGAGDDRSPAYRWIGYLYQDGKVIVIPQRALMGCLTAAAAEVPVPGSKQGNKTFKREMTCGITIIGAGWPLLVNGREIPYDKIKALLKEEDFEEHEKVVEKLGFGLSMERLPVGMSKHVRIRPEFMPWYTRGEIIVTDERIEAALQEILEIAGARKGLLDNRPNSPKCPGPHGTFEAKAKKIG